MRARRGSKVGYWTMMRVLKLLRRESLGCEEECEGKCVYAGKRNCFHYDISLLSVPLSL